MAREPQRILKLYQCSAPNNELHKEKWLSNEKVISPYIPKDNNSISNPHIIIHTFEEDEEHPVSLIAYNYCYIDDYQRYYFIEDMILLPQGQVEIVCKVDVLYSFKNSIGELVVHESRATNGTSNYLVDNEVATQVNAKPVVKTMSFNGTKFEGRGYADLEYIFKYFTKIHYNATDPTGRSTNQLSGASKNQITGITPLGDLTVTQTYIAKQIATFAKDWATGFDNYYHYGLTALTGNVTKFSHGACVYTNARGDYDSDTQRRKWKSTDGKANILFPGITAFTDEFVAFPVTRFDTYLGSSYGDARQDQIEFDGQTRNTHLNIVDVATIEAWNLAHPELEIPDGLVWNGWDCSSFAWRVCLFADKDYPIDINNSTVGSGYDCSTGSELAFLSNSGCLVSDACGLSDLIPGDIIFSGYSDSGAHYWVGYDEDDNEWKSTSTKSDSDTWTNVIALTHARVYIGNGKYVDTTGNGIDCGVNGIGGNLSNNVGVRTLGTLKANMESSNDRVVDLIEGSSKHIRVCRPALLWGSAYQS